MDKLEIKNSVSEIENCILKSFNLACEMMVFNFGECIIHSMCLTRIIKNNDILFTTLDYQNWDGEESKNNDEWYFKEIYCNEIVGGRVLSVEISPLNDLKIVMDNGISIEMYVSNGYNHYDDESEQWRLIKRNPDYKPSPDKKHFSLFHIVVNSKSVEKQSDIDD